MLTAVSVYTLFNDLQMQFESFFMPHISISKIRYKIQSFNPTQTEFISNTNFSTLATLRISNGMKYS